MRDERLTTFLCRICGKPVSLQECITDDIGEPVHKDCYAELKEKEAKKNDRKNSLAAFSRLVAW
jgi:hypothetical protein